MIFEVEVVTTTIKKVRVNGNDLSHACMVAKALDEKGQLADVRVEPVHKEYKAHCRCYRCNKKTRLYYTTDSEAYCLPCYKELSSGWQRKHRLIV